MIGFNRRKGIHYRHIGRYGEIFSVLVKYGFGDILARLNLERYLRVGRRIFKVKPPQQIESISHWDRVPMALEELGTTFIKLGQFAGNRPDVLPADLVLSLEKLQDAVLPFSETEAVKIIEQEFGKSIDKLFKEFEKKPFASASIAQVHKAVLNNGDVVAVKVQRPNIKDQIATDLEILYNLAKLAEKHVQGIEAFNVLQLVSEFSSALQKELDFDIEASHIRIFSANFKDDPNVHIPIVYKSLSSRRVITTEFIDGIKISDVKKLRESGSDPTIIAKKGASAVLKQIFVHGFFHADPHPGNILISEGGVICFLDLGMTGILTPSSKEKLSEIIIGVVKRDPQHIVRILHEFSSGYLENKEDLEYEISELIQEYSSRTLDSINVGDVFNRLSKILTIYRLRLIPGFYLLVKALATMEGIGYTLDPKFNFMEHLEPFVKKMLHEQFGFRHLSSEGAETLRDYYMFFRDLPSEGRDILQMLKTGRFRIEFEHRGLEPVLRKFDQIVNRLVFSLVLASLVIGSSIVVLSDVPPKIYGLPLFGIAGFLTAGIMGFSLLISILRHGKM